MQMKNIIVLAFCITLTTGCGKAFDDFARPMLMHAAKPSTGILPPVVNTVTPTNKILRSLPPPRRRVAIAVYNYTDQTGQTKTAETGQSLSKAVTQGSTSMLIKALQDAGEGSWFMVVERERLNNLLKERSIIANMRKIYLGEKGINPKALPPLLFAGIILEGGVIGYDSNTVTGGAGARYLGIGGDIQYRRDTVTVSLRAISTKTGQVLATVETSKTIIGYAVRGSIFKFIALDRLVEGEIGFTKNEPDQLAVQQAIEKAVLSLIVEGTERGLWAFSNKRRQNQMQKEYYTEQFGTDEAQQKLLESRARQHQAAMRKKEKARKARIARRKAANNAAQTTGSIGKVAPKGIKLSANGQQPAKNITPNNGSIRRGPVITKSIKQSSLQPGKGQVPAKQKAQNVGDLSNVGRIVALNIAKAKKAAAERAAASGKQPAQAPKNAQTPVASLKPKPKHNDKNSPNKQQSWVLGNDGITLYGQQGVITTNTE